MRSLDLESLHVEFAEAKTLREMKQDFFHARNVHGPIEGGEIYNEPRSELSLNSTIHDFSLDQGAILCLAVGDTIDKWCNTINGDAFLKEWEKSDRDAGYWWATLIRIVWDSLSKF